MFKKIIASFLVLATTSMFAMSLSALNGASKAELMEINGIGEVKAAAIMKERRKGKFKSFDDLTRVEGIGEQISSNVKNGVKVGQEPKKVKRTSRKKTTTKKSKTSKKDVKEKATKKTKKTKTKAKKSKKEKAEKKPRKRKIKSMSDKKKELKTKAKKTKTKKTKTRAKKKKKTKSKKKN
ncbi:MAG: helix-hairpin-helix domain-containing protein [Sulfurovum sp.]|nr:helix-hairpin-helix domain-containing protein [Sulfurovum sp.]